MKRILNILFLLLATSFLSNTSIAQAIDNQLEEQSFFRSNTNNNPATADEQRGLNRSPTGLEMRNNNEIIPGNPDDDPDNPVLDAIPVDNGLLALLVAGGLLGVWYLLPKRKRAEN